MTSEYSLIDLKRTFKIPRTTDDDLDDWRFFLAAGAQPLTWGDLHSKPVTVVLGGAGIGKTSEFKNEVGRLRKQKQCAFFIPLNELTAQEAWPRILGEPQNDAAWKAWRQSDHVGYFFLDAIDETRLNDPAKFKIAISIVEKNLRPFLKRVHIVLSSRRPDWQIADVQQAVDEYLAQRINIAASAAASRTAPTSDTAAFVVMLESLSLPQAKKYALTLSLQNESAFWTAIDDGGYYHIATRPLDLQWLVALWNSQKKLGTYKELIENSIQQRLTETNPNYTTSTTAISAALMREGTEILAAACEFSGIHAIAPVSAFITVGNTVRPQDVLIEDWDKHKIERLLASTIFDEASLGKIKFHHRSAREYLAACWLHRQLEKSYPYVDAEQLFAKSIFGREILISARRGMLCWLVAMNPKMRQWVVGHFPEILLFEGDPEAWDIRSVKQAFLGYIGQLRHGVRHDWVNEPSELMRVSRCLPPGLVAGLLKEAALPRNVTEFLLSMAKHGRLVDCADQVFRIYRQPTHPYDKGLALYALSEIASQPIRDAVKADLLRGALTTEEDIAAALTAIDAQSLTLENWVAIFGFADRPQHGFSRIAETIQERLLPKFEIEAANLLLEVMVIMLPSLTRTALELAIDSEREIKWLWLLYALPDCLGRVLTLVPQHESTYPPYYVSAVRLIEGAAHSAHDATQEKLAELRALVARHKDLRWQVIWQLAKSQQKGLRGAYLCGGYYRCITVELTDLPELLARMNQTDSPSQEQEITWELALEVGMMHWRGVTRHKVRAILDANLMGQQLANAIKIERERYVGNTKKRRETANENRRKISAEEKQQRTKFTQNIESIRNGTDFTAISQLLYYCDNRFGNQHQAQFPVVSIIAAIKKSFGEEIGEALVKGLQKFWTCVDIPKPKEVPRRSEPPEAWVALVSLDALLKTGTKITAFKPHDITRAAQLAIWGMNVLPDWFEELVMHDGKTVVAALSEWICDGALRDVTEYQNGRALAMVQTCKPTIRKLLLESLRPLFIAKNDKLFHSTHLWRLIPALRDDEILTSAEIADFCERGLAASIEADGGIKEIRWLKFWLEADAKAALAWINQRPIQYQNDKNDIMLKNIAEALGYCQWDRVIQQKGAVKILPDLHQLLARYHTIIKSVPGYNNHADSPKQVMATIRQELVQLRGAEAQSALKTIAELANETQKARCEAAVSQHVTLEANHLALIDPENISKITEKYCVAPKNENHLFNQVLGRLRDIKQGVEAGPFSDRTLFQSGILEKKLQLWLAARLVDTPNRLFSVHREEEVDNSKKTDIQVSFGKWNVCIEIKPVDKNRYSANSLVDTLRDQIVGQYLKGYNSQHGILLLLRLDNKKWNIPGGKTNQPFTAMVEYLQNQADKIKHDMPGRVHELIVLSIDCTKP
jgi:hypothetical protein